jgi:uncharacterized protein (TIGR03083 family)
MLHSPRPVLVAELFPEIIKHLLDLLKGFDQEDWNKPTVCPGWTVKDVALHLLGVEVGNLSSRRDRHSLGASIADWDDLVHFVNEWNEAWVQVSRRISAPLLIDLLELTGRQMCAYFLTLDLHAMGGSVSWAGPQSAPVWLDVAREYTERWHHQQHIRDAVGIQGLKQPKYFTPVLATFARALPHTFRNVNVSENTVVTLTIRGDSGGHRSIRREDQKWVFYEGDSEQSDSEVILPEDIAWRIFSRGLNKTQVLENVTLKGDSSLGSKVLDMVSIIA